MDKEELIFKTNHIVYRKVFDEEDCNRLLKYYKDFMPPKRIDNTTHKSMEKFLSVEEAQWIKEKLLPHIKELNDKFFKLPSLKLGTFGLLEYDSNSQLQWHHDIGKEFPYTDRKISIIIFISDMSDYKGGQLEFMPKLPEPLKMEKGYMIAFPSHKIHRVTVVTEGIRRVLINWIYEYNQALDNYFI